MGNLADVARERAFAEAAERPGSLVVTFDTASVASPETPPEAADGSAATLPPPAMPTEAESSYLIALRALRRATLEHTGTRSVEAVLVTRPRWSAWDAQLAALRGAAWPGAIRLVSVGGAAANVDRSGVAEGEERPTAAANVGAAEREDRPAAAANAGTPPLAATDDRLVAAVDAGDTLPRPAVAALEVLGYQVLDDGAPGGAAARLRFVRSDAADLDSLLRRAEAGDTVVVFGASLAPAADAPFGRLWDGGAWPEPSTPPRVLRVGAAVLDLSAPPDRAPGAAAAAPGVRLPVAWEDGAPAAASLSVGGGCLVRFGGPLDAGSSDPDYPALLRTLADGCRERGARAATPAAAAPLGRAATALLRGEGETAVPVSSLGEPEGRRLEPWLLLALFAATLGETVLVASRRRAKGATV
jgi:hypothetical protein